MGDQDDGALAVSVGDNRIDEIRFESGVESSGGLVGNEQRGFGNQDSCKPHPAFLTAGELLRERIESMAQADAVGHGLHNPVGIIGSVDRGGLQQVLSNRHSGIQHRRWVLEEKLEMTPCFSERFRGQGGKLLTEDLDPPFLEGDPAPRAARTNEVFPEPDSPMIPNTSPGATLKSTRSTAGFSARLFRNRLEREYRRRSP